MTPAEFKAWFDGFTEGISGRPTEKQWARICKRVKEVDGSALLSPIYVERYWPTVRPWRDRPVVTWGAGSMTCGATGTLSGRVAAASSSRAMRSLAYPDEPEARSVDGVAFLNAMGRADFAEAA